MPKRRRAPGEGTVFFREDKGLWVARYRAADGKPKVLYAKTQAEALRKRNEAQRLVAQGLPTPSDRLKVGPYLEQWLVEVKRQRAANTYAGYAVNVRCHIVPQIGHLPLARLTALQVQAMLHKLEEKERPRRDGKLSASTVRYVHRTLRAALQRALKLGLVQHNVAKLVDPPRAVPQEVQPLTPEAARRFLDAIQGDRLAALYSVAMALGLRQGEALGLRWQDVDLDGRRLHVRVQLQRVDGKLQPVELKTTKSRRAIDLPDVIVDSLRAHRRRQKEERLRAGELWQDGDLVFTTSVGTPLDRHNVTRYFQRILKGLDLEAKRFHDLRHTAASLLLAQGVPLHEVSAILGHSGIQITADIYGHLYEQRRREIADGMDAFLRGVR